jgi:DNA repair protein RecO (recombination protein O)
MLVEHQPAFVLHTRPYRDTSMLVDFLTPEFGRVTAVARGVRARKTLKRSLLNPFTCLLISFQGKTSLKLLTQFETEGAHFPLVAKHLYSGFYLNELLVRLLPEFDAHPLVYELYQKSLIALSQQLDLEPILRHFELVLLSELGYGIDFQFDAKTGEPINPEIQYQLDSQLGFFSAAQNTVLNMQFLGSDLLAIVNREFDSVESKVAAKKINRILLKSVLGSKPLNSRNLFS